MEYFMTPTFMTVIIMRDVTHRWDKWDATQHISKENGVDKLMKIL